MKSVIVLIFLLALITACDKDKFETKPKISIKSITNKIVPPNGSTRFTLEFTDKEGDVTDSLFVKKVRLNKRKTATNLDSFWTTIPDFPKFQKGEFLVDMDYQTILSAISPLPVIGDPTKRESDTLLVKFLARDKEGNKSDTITSEQIIVIRQ